MTQEQILGFIRHALSLLGGIGVTKGFFDEETLFELVGAAMTLIAFGWSYLSKKKEKDVLDVKEK